jgi:hypothetical protein
MVTFKVLLSGFFCSLLDVFIFFKVSFSIRLCGGNSNYWMTSGGCAWISNVQCLMKDELRMTSQN